MKRKIIAFLMAVMLVVTPMPVQQTKVSAAVSGITNNGTYTIVNVYNGKALTQTDMSTFYANAVVWNTSAISNLSRWKLTERDSYYSFTNIGSDKSMKICGTSAGSTCDFNGYDNSNNYKWALEPITSGTYSGCFYIRSAVKSSNGQDLYAEVKQADNDNSDGAQVALNTKASDESTRQIWRISASTAEDNTFTEANANTMVSAFRNKYFKKNDTTGYDTLGGGFWGIAEVMEGMLDGYELTGQSTYKDMFVGTFNDFVARNGDYWTSNNYNDDITWASIAACRAYMMLGNSTYLDIAKKNFDFMYNRASTYELNGVATGVLRWCEESDKRDTTHGCINGPATVAACYLGMATGDESYWEKAKKIYLAQRNSNLYVAEGDEAGRVNDCIKSDGSIANSWVSTYNQGTYLGSAVMLYNHYKDSMFSTDADNIMKYTLNHLCYNNILVQENTNNGDLAGMRGILVRYIRQYILEMDKNEYLSFFTKNATVAWMNRNSANIQQCSWQKKASENADWNESAGYNAISLIANIPTYNSSIDRDAYSVIEAEDMDYTRGLISENSSGTSGGRSLGGIQNGYYTGYYNVDFGSKGASKIIFKYSKINEGSNGTIEFRADATDGDLIASASISPTGDWSTWNTVTVNTSKKITGKHRIYVVFKTSTSYVCNFDYFQFVEYVEETTTPAPTTKSEEIDWSKVAYLVDGAEGGALNNTCKAYTSDSSVNIVNLQKDQDGVSVAYITFPIAVQETSFDGAKIVGGGVGFPVSKIPKGETKITVKDVEGNTYSVALYKEDVVTTTQAPTTTRPLVEGAELLKNTAFVGGDNWIEYGAEYTNNSNGSVSVSVPAYTSGENWSTQLKQTDIALVDGRWYKATVTVTSDVARKFQLLVQSDADNGGDWSVINQNTVFSVEAGVPYTYQTVFKANGIKNQYLYGLMMGYVDGTEALAANVIVSNVSLKEYSSEPATDVVTTVAPTTTQAPTVAPTQAPTQAPTVAPTQAPTQAPTVAPTQAPTQATSTTAGTSVEKPDKVVGLTFAGSEDLPYYFAWQASAKAESYNFYVNGTKIDSVVGTSYNAMDYFASVSNGEYTIGVTAVNADGESEMVTVSFKKEVANTPTEAPTDAPTDAPTVEPTQVPTDAPTVAPTQAPTTAKPIQLPTTAKPTTAAPTNQSSTTYVKADAVDKAIVSAKNDKDPADSTFGKLCAKVKSTTKKSNKVTWKKVSGATKYIVYAGRCGSKIKKVKESTGSSFTHKKLKKGKYYKYLIVAVDKNGNAVAISKMIHSATKGGKVGNAKKLKLNKKTVSLSVGKSFTIKAKQVADAKKVKIKNHRKISYETSNEKVAVVSGKGKITAKAKGTCTVYVYAQNGVYAKVTVKVK